MMSGLQGAAQNKLTLLAAQLDSSEKAAAANADTIAQLEAAARASAGDIAQLQAQLAAAQEQCSTHETEQSAVQAQCTQLTQQLAATAGQLQGAEVRSKELADANAQLDSKVASQLQQLAELEAQIAQLRAESAQLEQAVEGKAAALADATEREAAAARRAAQDAKAWRSEKLILVGERDGALAQVGALRGKISELAREVATRPAAGGSSDAAQQGAQAQAREVADLQAQLDGAKAELRAAQDAKKRQALVRSFFLRCGSDYGCYACISTACKTVLVV